MCESRRILVAALAFFGFSTIASAESPQTSQVLGQARGLIADGALDEAIHLLEGTLESSPEDDFGVLIDQLRKAYQVAILQSKRSGRHDLADHYSQNLKLIDAASAIHETNESTTAAVPPSIGSTDSVQVPSAQSALIASQSGGIAVPKASGNTDLSVPKPADDAQLHSSIDTAAVPTPSANSAVISEPPPASPPIDSRPVANELAGRIGSKIQQFDIAEADDAFRAKKYADAGRIYQQLMDAGNLPDSRRGHLAYCRSAALVDRINKNPASPAEWNEIRTEIERIQSIQPDFWFAEYLGDLVRERMNRSVATNSSSPQLASASSPGIVERTTNQIKSMNPLRKIVR